MGKLLVQSSKTATSREGLNQIIIDNIMYLFISQTERGCVCVRERGNSQSEERTERERKRERENREGY